MCSGKFPHDLDRTELATHRALFLAIRESPGPVWIHGAADLPFTIESCPQPGNLGVFRLPSIFYGIPYVCSDPECNQALF